jgi:hypothetical protein
MATVRAVTVRNIRDARVVARGRAPGIDACVVASVQQVVSTLALHEPGRLEETPQRTARV